MLPHYELRFASKEKVTLSAVRGTNWITAIMNHIGATLYFPMAENIDAALDSNPKVELLEPFTSEAYMVITR